MALPEGVGDVERLALPLKLAAIIIAPACPEPFARLILISEPGAGVLERDSAIHLLLGQRGQAGTEGADRRAHGPHQDALAANTPAGLHIKCADTDLDDLCFLAIRWRPIPAR